MILLESKGAISRLREWYVLDVIISIQIYTFLLKLETTLKVHMYFFPTSDCYRFVPFHGPASRSPVNLLFHMPAFRQASSAHVLQDPCICPCSVSSNGSSFFLVTTVVPSVRQEVSSRYCQSIRNTMLLPQHRGRAVCPAGESCSWT